MEHLLPKILQKFKAVWLVERGGGNKGRDADLKALWWILQLKSPWFEDTVVLGES